MAIPLKLIEMSPLIVVAICSSYFIIEVRRARMGYKLVTGRFLGRIVTGAIAGLATGFLVVIALTAVYNSPQGPLALIFFGPLATSLGVIFGTVKWRMRERNRQ